MDGWSALDGRRWWMVEWRSDGGEWYYYFDGRFVLLLLIVDDGWWQAAGRESESGGFGLSVPGSTAEYVRRDPGMSGFPRSSFDQIPPDDDWWRNGFGPKSHGIWRNSAEFRGNLQPSAYFQPFFHSSFGKSTSFSFVVIVLNFVTLINPRSSTANEVESLDSWMQPNEVDRSVVTYWYCLPTQRYNCIWQVGWVLALVTVN